MSIEKNSSEIGNARAQVDAVCEKAMVNNNGKQAAVGDEPWLQITKSERRVGSSGDPLIGTSRQKWLQWDRLRFGNSARPA